MSPVLLVRGNAMRDLPLVVADGYHRIWVARSRLRDLATQKHLRILKVNGRRHRVRGT